MADVPIDYTSADYQEIKRDLLRHAEILLPEWTSRSEADFGVVLAELFSHAADLNNYSIDRLLAESYLPTATTMHAVMTIADVLGYVAHNATPATGTVTLVTDPDGPAVTVPKGTGFASRYLEAIDGVLRFESTQDVTVPANGGTVQVPVAEGRTTTKLLLGASDGTELQRFAIPNIGVIDGSIRVHVEAPYADIEWTYVARMIYSGPTDPVFTVRPDPEGTTSIYFGDGVNGMIPPLGSRVYATYRSGEGRNGNLGAGQIWTMSDGVDGVTIATDTAGAPISTAMVGGGDREDIEEIRRNASLAYAAFGRAITLADYSKIALTVPGVSAANAVSNVSSSVVVYIAGPGRTTPSVDLINSVTAQLTSASAAGVRVNVQGPTIIKVNFGSEATPMQLTVAPTYRRFQVETNVRNTLTSLVNSPDNGFGSRITIGEVYGALTAIPGVVNITIPVLARHDAAQTVLADAVMAAYELPQLGTITMATSGGVV
ncbi:baseplate J/gp47 family protein [Nonomuraea sp. SYSU D8015]|uniref:baseplate J/gp47 family protein n=1 Tax=Nonomuraea sp. SYSU D8015 TaxID=2593644 RepID=UPI0016615FE0|nr:baseplate J/gp47 family protein [Nonomuraea sp. SYSU D8015]